MGKDVINNLKKKAKKFKDKRIVCISSTNQGGGVAEMLNSLVILFNDLGINFGWRIIHGSPDFFAITKSLHNALQGAPVNLSRHEKEIYLNTNERYSIFTHLNHDLVIVHDPQPLALINFYKKRQPWIWRCHIDLTNSDKKVWNFLSEYIDKYDQVVVSDEAYRKDLSNSQDIIHPAIDPLSDKNRKLTSSQINKILSEQSISLSKPIITQISRFDKWKDPEGVIKIFDMVKKKSDCQLVLLGNTATDDPEGVKVYSYIKKFSNKKNIKILVNVKNNDLTVNALQSKASVVIQKSIREGFALTISEAAYKSTPVVASNIGGMPLQIINNESGYLHDPLDYKSFADSIVKILKDKKHAVKLGKRGKKYIEENFLITRLIEDWLDLFAKYL